jgi:predicted RNase H-like HicB family nuclease
MPHKYELVLSWSPDDDAFVVEVPDLPGCAADGTSRGEAVVQIEQAIELWLATARELGRPIPKPRVRTGNQVGRS